MIRARLLRLRKSFVLRIACRCTGIPDSVICYVAMSKLFKVRFYIHRSRSPLGLT